MKKTSSTPLSYSEREERKFEKKIRMKEQRYRETEDKKYLNERDALQDELDSIRRNRRTNEKIKKAKAEKEARVVSDDQLFNEARKYNRQLKNEAMKKEKEESKKKEERLKNRAQAKKKLYEKKKTPEKGSLLEERKQTAEEKKKWSEYRTTFEQEYKKMNPEKSLDPSTLQKLAIKNYRGELQKVSVKRGVKEGEKELEKRIKLLNSISAPEEEKVKVIEDMKELFKHESEDAMNEFSDVIDIAIEDLESI